MVAGAALQKRKQKKATGPVVARATPALATEQTRKKTKEQPSISLETESDMVEGEQVKGEDEEEGRGG